MGVFSEIDADGMTGRENEVAPFTLEPQDADAAEPFCDDAKQQAEAQAASAALEYLNQQDGEPCTDEPEEDEGDEEEPAETPLTPAQKKQAHEEAEAKRKAEWEAQHQEKEEAELMAWETAVAVSDEELVAASMGRVGKDAERITRRNMKNCVAEHIQTKCLEDMDFARQAMHPRKNMINCFKYINRMAFEFVKQEMEDNDVKPNNGDGYGSDIPDGLCYKWAEDYFGDMEAKEDMDESDKFVPKPYPGPSPKSKKPATKKTEKKASPNAAAEKTATESTDDRQLSFGAQTSLMEVSA